MGVFRRKSTETLLLLLTKKWKHTVENGEVFGTLFVNFRKAFDSVDHQILFKNLQGFGINVSALETVQNYLTNRHQYTEINGSTSQAATIKYRVAQGSLLGLKIFIRVINYLLEKMKKGQLMLLIIVK